MLQNIIILSNSQVGDDWRGQVIFGGRQPPPPRVIDPCYRNNNLKYYYYYYSDYILIRKVVFEFRLWTPDITIIEAYDAYDKTSFYPRKHHFYFIFLIMENTIKVLLNIAVMVDRFYGYLILRIDTCHT